MSTSYRPFPIMEFKTGINTYMQPWIRPMDAFEPLVNAYVSRGVVTKRAGYSQFGNTLDDENPVMGLVLYINESTDIPFLVALSTENLYLYDAGSNTFGALTSDLFTGNISNFFNWVNWQPTSGSTSYLYLANGEDPITRYDGAATVDQPTLTIDGLGTTIDSALDVKVYKNRLLAIRPTLSSGGTQNQSIYWSATLNPTNFLNTTTGNGGFLAAPTGDIIQSAEFLRDVLVVFFSNSTWIFRYTGNDFDPFRFDRINTSKSTNAPYASVQYDERVTSIGNTGLIACDGVNVQRYDIPIIDFYENTMSEQYYDQAFSQRYDNLNQSWTLFVSQSNNFEVVGSIAPGSDQALVYNFLENSWCTYTFQIPLTCMGLFYKQSGTTWEELDVAPDDWWQNTDYPWQSYYTQSGAPILLAGDTSGNVWLMDDGQAVTDKEIVDSETVDLDIVPDIVSTRWNPIIQSGQKIQFGYIDIYYLVVSTNPDDPVQVTLNFYVDNSDTKAASRPLTLDGPLLSITKTIATGDGTDSYSGTISGVVAIAPNTLSIVVTTTSGIESFDDDGSGVLTGSLGDSGMIVYSSGVFTITLTDGRTVDSGEAFVATYDYTNFQNYTFKRIYLNLIGQFVQMEIDPTVNSLMQFSGFIIWARPSGRLTPL